MPPLPSSFRPLFSTHRSIDRPRLPVQFSDDAGNGRMPEWEEREDEKGRQAGESAPSNLALSIFLKVGKTSNDLTHSDVTASSAFIVRLTKTNLGWNGKRERARKWRLPALEVSFISIAVSTTPLRAAKISHRRRKGGSPIKVLSAHQVPQLAPRQTLASYSKKKLILAW